MHRPKTGCQTHFPIANSAHDYKNTQNAHAPTQRTQRTQRTHARDNTRRDIRTDCHWGNTSGIPKHGPVSAGNGIPGQYLALQHAYPVRACVTKLGHAWNPTGGEGTEGGTRCPRTPERSAIDTIHEHVYITVVFIRISPDVRPVREENVRCGRNTYRAHEESAPPGPTWTLETVRLIRYGLGVRYGVAGHPQVLQLWRG